MGEKFRPENQPAKPETSERERPEVLSPLGRALLGHALDRIEDPAARAEAAPRLRQWILELDEEEQHEMLGFGKERGEVLRRLHRNAAFRDAVGGFATGTGIMLTITGAAAGAYYGYQRFERVYGETDVSEMTQMDSRFTPERMRRLTSLMPRGFAGEVSKYGFRSEQPKEPSNDYVPAGTPIAGVTEHGDFGARTEVFFYRSLGDVDGCVRDLQDWFHTLVHETVHSNDDGDSHSMSGPDKKKLREWLNQRIVAEDRYRTDYVEQVIKVDEKKVPDPKERAERERHAKGTEYLAQLGAAYVASDNPEKQFSPEDLKLIRWFIGLKDPHFDQRASRLAQLRELQEMQELADEWRRTEQDLYKKTMLGNLSGLPLTPDELEYFKIKLGAVGFSPDQASSWRIEAGARARRAELVKLVREWGTTPERRDWIEELLRTHGAIDELRDSFNGLTAWRSFVEMALEDLRRKSARVAEPLPGVTPQEAEMFRSRIIRLRATRGQTSEAQLEPGEYAELLDWGDENPGWTISLIGLVPAEADYPLYGEVQTRILEGRSESNLDSEEM